MRTQGRVSTHGSSLSLGDTLLSHTPSLHSAAEMVKDSGLAN